MLHYYFPLSPVKDTPRSTLPVFLCSVHEINVEQRMREKIKGCLFILRYKLQTHEISQVYSSLSENRSSKKVDLSVSGIENLSKN